MRHTIVGTHRRVAVVAGRKDGGCTWVRSGSRPGFAVLASAAVLAGCGGLGCTQSPPTSVDYLQLPVDWLALDGGNADWPSSQPFSYQSSLLQHMQNTFSAMTESGTSLEVEVSTTGAISNFDSRVVLTLDTSGLTASDTYIRASMPQTQAFGCSLLNRAVEDCSVFIELVPAPRLRWVNTCGSRVDAKFGRELNPSTQGSVTASVDGQACIRTGIPADAPMTVSFACPTSEYDALTVAIGPGLQDVAGVSFRTLTGESTGTIELATKDLLIAAECPDCCGTWIPRL